MHDRSIFQDGKDAGQALSDHWIARRTATANLARCLGCAPVRRG